MNQTSKKGSGSRPGPFSGWRGQCTPFQRKVYEAALKIPSGQVRTYAEIARAIGQPKAARAVGQALRRNRWALAIPCHRVVASDGSLGGYTAPGGVAQKRRLLQSEGVRRGLTPFVDRVLAPWRTPPVPPAGLVRPGAVYLPSSQRMHPATARRFRDLAWDLIVRSTGDVRVRQQAQAAVDTLLERVDGEVVPGRRMRDVADAEVVEMYCAVVRAVTGVRDPYAAVKHGYTAQALAHLPEIADVVESLAAPTARWRAAISLGILGNAMDFADPLKRAQLEADGFDMRAELRRALTLRYARGLDARDAFLTALRRAPRGEILFLADNAGEIVFDLPLIRLWLVAGRPVTLVGKSTPCYNDVTADDLRALLRDRRVRGYVGRAPRVLAGGTRTIGLDLRRATPTLARAWRQAALVYAKGQGMVQTLRYAALTRDVFHAVQVKDPAYFHEGVRLHPGAACFLHTRPV